MSLNPGTRLGPYEITGAIGAGGMGEVYRARVTKLHRDVAVKVLPAIFASDPDRLARFEREAQTLAALNHPNIAQIFGIESQGSTLALVMELVEGEDLAHRIARGPLLVEDALPIATQIAEALEAAHECGIIHRDLKPANIRPRGDGVVKVLDFGLAKALDPIAASSAAPIANSPTFTSPVAMTQMGLVPGTAAYMAPEQAKGRRVVPTCRHLGIRRRAVRNDCGAAVVQRRDRRRNTCRRAPRRRRLDGAAAADAATSPPFAPTLSREGSEAARYGSRRT